MSASGMGGQLGRHEAREIAPEQAPNAVHESQLHHSHDQSSAGSRGAVDLNLNLAPLQDRPAPHQLRYMYTMPPVQSQTSSQDQLNNNFNTAHIDYGPPTRIQQGVSNANNVIETIPQEEINTYNQERVNFQRNLLYYPGAMQRGNILSARATPYQIHQTNLEQLQSLQQQHQPSNVAIMQSYGPADMMQYNQQFNQNLITPGIMENLMYPSRRIPNHVRQQRMRRRSRANRAHVTHINTVAADMALGHSDTANVIPGTIPESAGGANLENSQSESHSGVRQERRLQGVSIAIAEDTCVSSIGENFECNICFQKADEAVVTCCGHLFCWPCLYRWLHVHSSHKECPVCKGAVDHECSITPIYGRENASATARKHCTLGAERIPPRPPARRVESARQVRERGEREREREVREREAEQRNVASNITQDQPNQDGNSPNESHDRDIIFEQGVPRNDGGGNNILVQLDQRERIGTRSDFRDRNMLNFSIDPGAADLEQRDDSTTHANTSNRPREDNYAYMYMDGREDGTMPTANISRDQESNAYMTTDQREVRTQNIFHDLPTVEDAQPNLLRGGAPPNAGGVFESSSISASSRAHLLHQRMAQRREQLRAALAASRNIYASNLIDHPEGRQDVMQAAALLSQEWDDLVDISRVAVNPVQAASWLTTMHARLADMETNSHSFRQQAQNTLAEHSSTLGPALQAPQEVITRDATIDQPLESSQTGELLTAMHARFNNIQRIMETLQRPSFALSADHFSPSEPLDVERTASGGTGSHQENSQLMDQRPSEATALSEGSAPELSYNGQDGADLICHGEFATQQRSVHGNDDFSFRGSGDYPSLENSGEIGATLPLLALIEQRRGSSIDGDESSLPLPERQNEGNIREQRGSGAGDIVLEMNPTTESPTSLQNSEWPTSTRARWRPEDDEGDHRDRSGDETENTVNIATGVVESVAGTRDRKRRRMTDTV